MLDPSTGLSTIGDGVNIGTNLTIGGIDDVATIYGRLSGAATFNLSIDGAAPVAVVVPGAATELNNSVDELIVERGQDIDAALAAAGLAAQVSAQRGSASAANRVELVALGGVSAITLAANNGDPAINELGFQANQSGADDGGTLKLKGGKDVPGLLGRLSADALLSVTMNTANGGMPVSVVVAKSDTGQNRNILDVVNDVQSAVNAVAALSGKIDVSSIGRRLIFTATEPGTTTFVISASAGNPAVTELGLAANNIGNSVEFTITTRDGVSSGIILDGLTTLQDVIDAIGAQSIGKVTAIINDNGTGLKLTDNTAGSGTFAVQSANAEPRTWALGSGGTGAFTPDSERPLRPCNHRAN